MLDKLVQERKSMKELIGLDAESSKACLRGVCQSIANAATDEGNVKCYQLTNHEFFRDIRGNKEDYKAMIRYNKNERPFDAQRLDALLEGLKEKFDSDTGEILTNEELRRHGLLWSIGILISIDLKPLQPSHAQLLLTKNEAKVDTENDGFLQGFHWGYNKLLPTFRKIQEILSKSKNQKGVRHQEPDPRPVCPSSSRTPCPDAKSFQTQRMASKIGGVRATGLMGLANVEIFVKGIRTPKWPKQIQHLRICVS